MAKPEGQDELENRVRNTLLTGQNIGDEELVDLMACKVKSLRSTASGFVLLDFPQNQAQWEAIQKHLPRKEEEPERKSSQPSLDIVYSRPPPQEEKRLKTSFIDLVIYV